MGIPINTGFDSNAPVSIDNRFVLTKSQMLNVDDNKMPEAYFCICKDDLTLYVYDKNMDIDKISEVTGKFKPATQDDLDQMYTTNKISNYEVSSATTGIYVAIADINGENRKIPLSSLAGFLMDQNNLVDRDYVDSKFDSINMKVGKTFNMSNLTSGTFNDVVYGSNRIVAASTDATGLMYSEDDGVTWNTCTFVNDISDVTGDIVQSTKIRFVFSKFFAVVEHQNAKYIYTSTDGMKFTNTTIVVDDVVEKNNTFYYVRDRFVFYTTDGVTWNNASVRKNLEPVNSFFVENSEQNMLLTEDAWSDDGGYVWNAYRYMDTTTGVANEIANSEIVKIVEVPTLNLWIAILSTGGLYYSEDAKVWYDCTFNATVQDFSKEITDICVTDNILVASNYNTSADRYRAIYSTNGKEWYVCSFYNKDGESMQYLEGNQGIGKVTYNGSIFVYGGAEFYSNDGRSWYPTTLDTNVLSYDYDHPIYKEGIWVATPNTRVGVSGPIIQSTDGKVWTMNDSGLSGKIGDLMFEYGIFLARTMDQNPNTMYYSLNGTTWNQCVFDSNYNVTQNPVFNGDVWVMVTSNDSNDAVLLYSVDGINWNYAGTESNHRIDYQKNPVWIGTAWLFILKNKTTGNSKIITSRDGIRWSEKSVSGPDININDTNNYAIIVYLQKKVFLTSISKQQTWYSEDKAASFYLCKKNTILEINHPNVFIDFNNGKFYSMNNNYPYNVISSSDGVFWTVIDALGTSTNPDDFSIVFKNVNNGCVSFNNIIFYTLDNGVTWNASTETTTEIPKLYSNDSIFLLYSENVLKYSHDGSDWNTVTIDTEVVSYTHNPVWNGKVWVAFGKDADGNGVIITSADGITWTNVTGNTSYGDCCSDLEWNNNIWVATGTTGVAYSDDNVNWIGATLYDADGQVVESIGYQNIYNSGNGITVLYSTNTEYSSGIAVANKNNGLSLQDETLAPYKAIDLTQAEYDAIPVEERSKTNPYNCYDTGRIYKNGVLYGEKKSEILTLEEYQALEDAGLVEEDKDYFISTNEEGSPLFDAKYIKYDNTISGGESKNVQGAIDDHSGRITALETSVTTKESVYITNDASGSGILYNAAEYLGVNSVDTYGIYNLVVTTDTGESGEANFIYKHRVATYGNIISENGVTFSNLNEYGTILVDSTSANRTFKVKYLGEPTEDMSGLSKYEYTRGNKNALVSDINPTIDRSKVFSDNTLNISTLYSTYGNGRYVIVGQGTNGNGSATIDIWTLTSNAISYIVNVTYSNKTSNTFVGYTYDKPTIDFDTGYINHCNHIAKVCTLV